MLHSTTCKKKSQNIILQVYFNNTHLSDSDVEIESVRPESVTALISPDVLLAAEDDTATVGFGALADMLVRSFDEVEGVSFIASIAASVASLLPCRVCRRKFGR